MDEEETKTEKFWLVQCLMCETQIWLALESFRYRSEDQAAEFIIMPTVICGKCFSNCIVELEQA